MSSTRSVANSPNEPVCTKTCWWTWLFGGIPAVIVVGLPLLVSHVRANNNVTQMVFVRPAASCVEVVAYGHGWPLQYLCREARSPNPQPNNLWVSRWWFGTTVFEFHPWLLLLDIAFGFFLVASTTCIINGWFKKRGFRFSIRTLFVITAGVAVVCSLLRYDHRLSSYSPSAPFNILINLGLFVGVVSAILCTVRCLKRTLRRWVWSRGSNSG